LNPSNFYKVSIQYLQKSDVLVAAQSEENAAELVTGNIVEGTEQFAVLAVAPLTDEEKQYVINQMTGLAPSDEIAEPSGEVQDTRTLN
jgi:hypothetical protein